MKHQFGLESFHSNRVDGIEQEIYAVLTWMTLSAMVQVMAEKAVDKLSLIHIYTPIEADHQPPSTPNQAGLRGGGLRVAAWGGAR